MIENRGGLRFSIVSFALGLLIIMLLGFSSCKQAYSDKPHKIGDIYNKQIEANYELLSLGMCDSAYSVLQDLRKIAIATEDSLALAKVLIEMGDINRPNVTLVVAEHYINEALGILEQQNDPSLYALALKHSGMNKQALANYEASQQLFFKALHLCDSIKDSINSTHLYNLIGLNLLTLNETDQAIAYFTKTFELAKKLELVNLEFSGYLNLGVLYRSINPDSARYYYNKILTTPYLVEQENFRIRVAYNMANLDFDIGNYNKALEQFEMVRKFSEKQAFSEGIAMSLNGIASVYSHMGRHNQAIQLLNAAITHFADKGKIEQMLELQKEKIKILRQIGDYKEIDSIYSIMMPITDSLTSQNKQASLQDLHLFYQSQQKEIQNEKLKTELSVAQYKNTLWLIVFVVAILICSYLFYYFRTNIKQKRQSLDNMVQLLKQEEEKHKHQHLEVESLKSKIDLKQSELTELSGQLSLLQNELQERNQDKDKYTIEELTDSDSGKSYWENLSMKFNVIYPGFLDQLVAQYPQLNTNDIQFCMLLKLNLALKDIANVFNISQHSLYKRKYRLIDKMKLELSSNDIYAIVQSIK